MRIVMLTDDVQIDRRILLEAESLYRSGHEIILLAERGTGLESHELIGNIKIERIQTPDSSKGELILIRLSTYLNRFLSRTSRLIIAVVSKSFSLFSRAVSKVFSLVVRAISKAFSALIRINQRSTNFLLRVLRKSMCLSLRERALVDRIKFYNPDVIHAHDLPQLRAAVKAKRRLNIPLVYDAHELYPEIGTLTSRQKKILSIRERRYIKDADKVITVNKYIAAEMVKRYKLPSINVVHNATDWPHSLAAKKWDRFRETFPIKHSDCIVLFQGWMSLNRGLQPLVLALALLPKSVHLVFMGYGEARPSLESMVIEESLQGRVHFMEAVPQSELLSWTASADVGVIPYQPVDLNNYYCSPNKLFEFIQAELPIVANDLPFLRDIVKEEGFGVVRNLESAEDYANAIEDILNDDKLRLCRDKLSKRRNAYSWNAEQKKLLSIYQSIFAKECVSA